MGNFTSTANGLLVSFELNLLTKLLGIYYMREICGGNKYSSLIWHINNYDKELGFYFLFGRGHRKFRAGIDDSNFIRVGRCKVGSGRLPRNFRRYRIRYFSSINKYTSYMFGMEGARVGDYRLNRYVVKYKDRYWWSPQDLFLRRLYYEFRVRLESRSWGGGFQAMFFGPLIRNGGFPGHRFEFKKKQRCVQN